MHYNEPPSYWRRFSEITFRVSNFHSRTTPEELRPTFESYGCVHRIETDTDEGIVYVTYRPVPRSPFWEKAVRFHGRPLLVEYHNHTSVPRYFRDPADKYFRDPADNKVKLRSHSLQAKGLEMGVYTRPNVFVSEAMYTRLIKFTINYQRRDVRIQFCIPDGQIFKMEIEFKDINSEIHISQQGSDGSVTIANKFPARYWMLQQGRSESWIRKAAIRTIRDTGMETVPLQPHMPDNSEQLGKWVVFRITFDLNGVGRDFNEMIQKASEYNLAPKPAIIKDVPLDTIDGSRLRKYMERSMLSFDVLYMIECNLSFNYLHDYNLSQEFLTLLAQLPTESAVNILENIFAAKKRVYDPLSYLKNAVKHVEKRSKHVPHYCTMMRKVLITPTTMYVLVPTMETSNRVIRHFIDKKDHFLRVQFVDEGSRKVGSSGGTSNDALYNRIFRVLRNGIKIGGRHYEFLAFSSSQLRDHSCWFFAPTYDTSANDIRRWMGDFSNIKSVSKYAARMGQCFSSTRYVARLPVDDITMIDDIIRNRFTFSDGIGKISNSLSEKIAKTLELKIVPSAFQFRLGGCKGVLCLSKHLRGNQIQVRPSQCKFRSDHRDLEVIKCSTFIPAYLNRQAITLLSVLGVPDQVFIDMKNAQVSKLDKMSEDDNTAVSVLQQNIDEHGIALSLVDLVKAGFLQRKDRYLMNLISLFKIMMMRDLKKKAKIRVDKGAFLLGVLDETETLREGEIYCCVSDPCNPSSRKVITGTCIVYRNPCFHPGDIRLVTAVDRPALKHLVDVVVFSSLGYRDVPSECSGGDLDGDDFTLIYDEKLIPRNIYGPMNYEAPKPDTVERVTMADIKKFFVNYILSDQLGMIANAHLAKADISENGALHGQCVRLAQLHSEAVDFPKTGIPAYFPSELRARKFPDFMEKWDKETYISEKVLGAIYRSIEVSEFVPYTCSDFDERLYVEGYTDYLDEARALKKAYDADIKGLMNQFGIMTEFEAVSGFIVNAVTKVDRKKPRDVTKSVLDAVIPIRKHYKKCFEKEFYHEGTNAITPEAQDRMHAKAYAWYYVTYHPSELRDESMISFPWIVHQTLCDIARNNSNGVRGNHRQSESIGTSMVPIQPYDITINDEIDDIERLRQSIRNVSKRVIF